MGELDYWKAMLNGTLDTREDTPHLGYYRRRPYKGAPWQPVAVFKDETGEIVAVVGDEKVAVHKVWSPFLEAITEDQYRSARREGRFPDEYEAHPFANSPTPMTTELRDAKPVMPIIMGNNSRGPANTRQ